MENLSVQLPYGLNSNLVGTSYICCIKAKKNTQKYNLAVPFDLFSEMQVKEAMYFVIIFNEIVAGICGVGRLEDAYRFLQEMVAKVLVPSNVTFNIFIHR